MLLGRNRKKKKNASHTQTREELFCARSTAPSHPHLLFTREEEDSRARLLCTLEEKPPPSRLGGTRIQSAKRTLKSASSPPSLASSPPSLASGQAILHCLGFVVSDFLLL
ncbi:hypothetical protein SLEP1_g44430 [Rubroshorea leprosula]|uniref:Uncharacterized protein n=1 Tax=Rubroshorea leprosula TaxID=152421 RepID=A0AAV5LHF1_9ROSI|nr:hypothetical protein SLEP1_g44430 [Rubroshorea leprosula]